MSARVASPHLARLGAHARPAGSAAAREAREYCAGVLAHAGFVVKERSFEYSIFPGGWATPIGGVVASLAAIGFYLGRLVPGLLVATIALCAVAALALGYVGRRGVLDLPLMRRRAVNLEASRDGEPPTVWLVAHLDSKWQPVSMIARVAGVIGTAIGLVASIAIAFAPGRVGNGVATAVLMATWLATVPLMLSIVGDRNTGALDNASGVAAVLGAAELVSPETRVGILITDAEELGLAGARAWARHRAPGVAINCDSLDDHGRITVMYSGSRPAQLLPRVEAAAASYGEPARVMRLIPGILTDSVALASAGWETLTLSRGSLRTLQRIHTSRDTLASMRATGIENVSRILAHLATELG